MNRHIRDTVAVLILALFIGAGSFVSQAFVSPTASAPNSNTSGPLNNTTTPQSKGGSSIPAGSLLDIVGSASANYLFAWNDATVNDELTVQGLLAGQTGWTTGLRPVCVDTAHKLFICSPICGNTYIEQGEQCDDGGILNGDGCSSTCQSEGPPPVCGNTVIEAGEQCDDGNTQNGDGCDSACQTENPGIIQNYTYTSDGGAIFDVCSVATSEKGDPTYFGVRDEATRLNAIARGVTSVFVDYEITTDNQNGYCTRLLRAEFYPNDVQVGGTFNDGQSIQDFTCRDAFNYCSAVVTGELNDEIFITENF